MVPCYVYSHCTMTDITVSTMTVHTTTSTMLCSATFVTPGGTCSKTRLWSSRGICECSGRMRYLGDPTAVHTPTTTFHQCQWPCVPSRLFILCVSIERNDAIYTTHRSVHLSSVNGVMAFSDFHYNGHTCVSIFMHAHM